MSRLAFLLTALTVPCLLAESGIDAWLRYAALDDAAGLVESAAGTGEAGRVEPQ